MTSTQVVETSVTTTDNSPSQDYTYLDDQTTLLQNNFYLTSLSILITSQLDNLGILEGKFRW